MTFKAHVKSRRSLTTAQFIFVLAWFGALGGGAFLLATLIGHSSRFGSPDSSAVFRSPNPTRYLGVLVTKSPGGSRCMQYTIDNKHDRFAGAAEVPCPGPDQGDAGEPATERPPGLGNLETERFRSVKKAFGGMRY